MDILKKKILDLIAQLLNLKIVLFTKIEKCVARYA